VSALDPETSTTVGVVILTTGDRDSDLATIMDATSSLTFDERVLVGNGTAPPERDGWRSVTAPQNLGVPGGRSFGIATSSSDVIVFLDDDSQLPAEAATLVEDVRRVFDSDSTIGALAFRVVITNTNESMRRWSPRPTRATVEGIVDVPTFPGNGHALRRSAFKAVDGYLDELFFKHEETELSWRLLDAGWRVVTDSTIVVEHPETPEARHERAVELGLRNKIWMARLRLPVPCALLTGVVSTARTLSRCRSMNDVRAAFAGLRSGFGALPGDREPISWATVAKLTKAGRPPIF